jgi:ABC-type branched-subunit amino acid transport system substrate-binding protein
VREIIGNGAWAFSGFTPALWEAAKADLIKAGLLGFPFDVGAERQRQERLAFPGYQNCIRAQAGIAEAAVKAGAKKIAFLELDIEAVDRCITYSADLAKKLGAEVVFRGKVAPGAPDCAPQVLAARGNEPDVVIQFMDVLGTVKCMQARKQQRLDIPFLVGMNVAGDQAFVDALGADAEGISTFGPYAMPGTPGYDKPCGDLVKKYFPKHEKNFWYTATGCAPAIVLVTALRALGPQATRDEVVSYLETHPIPTGGLTPDIVFKPGDHRPYDQVAPVTVKNGKWVQTGPYFTPGRLSDDISDGD